MATRVSMILLAMGMALGVASAVLMVGAPAAAQTTQHSTTSEPATATPAAPSMPMQMEHGGHGMGGMSGGQGHSGMMGGQHAAPMGSMPQCPAGQTASGNPPTCK
jgi:hypothetical protein